KNPSGSSACARTDLSHFTQWPPTQLGAATRNGAPWLSVSGSPFMWVAISVLASIAFSSGIPRTNGGVAGSGGASAPWSRTHRAPEGTPAFSSTSRRRTPVQVACPTAPWLHWIPAACGTCEPRPLPKHWSTQVTVTRSNWRRSSRPKERSPRVPETVKRRSRFKAGGPKCERTKKARVGVISWSSAESGVERSCGQEECWTRAASSPARAPSTQLPEAMAAAISASRLRQRVVIRRMLRGAREYVAAGSFPGPGGLMLLDSGVEVASHARVRRPPVTPGLPLVGSLFSLLSNPYRYLLEARERHGDIFTLDLGVTKAVVLSHPDHVQRVFVDKAPIYRKGGGFWEAIRTILGNGLPVSEGDFWMRQRRMMQPHFHRQKLAGLTGLMIEAIDEALAGWETA